MLFLPKQIKEHSFNVKIKKKHNDLPYFYNQLQFSNTNKQHCLKSVTKCA